MEDKEYLESQLLKQRKKLKMVFDSERQMRALGNSGMVQVRQKEYRTVEASIKKLETQLKELQKE